MGGITYNHACYPGGEQKMQGSLGKQAFCTPFISSKPFLLPDHARPVQVPNPHLSWYTRSCISAWDPVDP